MASPNLGITEVTKAQNDKVTTINSARNNLELALTDPVSKAVTDGADTVLTTTEAGEALGNVYFDFTSAGDLTANRNVEVPVNQKLYACRNSTTGGFTVTVKTNAGTGVAIEPGATKLLYCDGTNVVVVATPGVVALQGSIACSGSPVSEEHVCPVAGRIRRIRSIVQTALGGGACVLTADVNTTLVTGSTVTVAASAAKGDRDDSGAISHATTVVAAGDRIEVNSDGGSASGTVKYIVEVEPDLV